MAGCGEGGTKKISKNIKIEIEIKTKKEIMIKIKDKSDVRWCRWCEED